MPPHQRAFPRREQSELPGVAGSRALAVMVAWYLVAMFAGILLLGYPKILRQLEPRTKAHANSN
jgi:hypothetical protein